MVENPDMGFGMPQGSFFNREEYVADMVTRFIMVCDQYTGEGDSEQAYTYLQVGYEWAKNVFLVDLKDADEVFKELDIKMNAIRSLLHKSGTPENHRVLLFRIREFSGRLKFLLASPGVSIFRVKKDKILPSYLSVLET